MEIPEPEPEPESTDLVRTIENESPFQRFAYSSELEEESYTSNIKIIRL
jgi:hypothetical protein